MQINEKDSATLPLKLKIFKTVLLSAVKDALGQALNK